MLGGKLCVDLAGLKLGNPTILASGILGTSAEYLTNIVIGGAGAIVTKSVGKEPRRGYENPTVFQTDLGLINALGLPNPGIDEFIFEIAEATRLLNVPVIASVYGFSAREYAEVAQKASESGANAVELNVSCPHVLGTGLEIGQDHSAIREVVRRVRASVEIPVFVKLSPNVTDIAEIASIAAEAGADAITAINTMKAMAIDVETGMPVLRNKTGGLSGPALKPIALRCVYEIYRRVEIPIIGCGGVSDWRDALEFLMSGASAVQIGTALSTKGTNVFKDITREIESYLDRKNISCVNDVVGISHRL